MKTFKLFKKLLVLAIVLLTWNAYAYAGEIYFCGDYGSLSDPVFLYYSKSGGSGTKLVVAGNGQSDLSLGTVSSLVIQQFRAVTKAHDARVCAVYLVYGINTSRNGDKNNSIKALHNTSGYSDWTWDSYWGVQQFKNASVDLEVLTGLAPGNYYFDYYFTMEGNTDNSENCYANCGYWSNNGGNYHMSFTVPSKTLTVQVNGTANGNSVTGGQSGVSIGTEYTITATPVAGYKFSGWSATSGGSNITIADASSATTTVTFNKLADVTVKATFVPTYGFIEGRFMVKDATRTTTTYTKSDGVWQTTSTAIAMDKDNTNHRFYKHTYCTPAQLANLIGTQSDKNPYFFVSASTASNSVTSPLEYWATSNSSNNDKLLAAGTAGRKAVTNTGGYAFTFMGNSTSTGYAIIYSDKDYIWYELEHDINYDANGGSGDAPTPVYFNNNTDATVGNNVYSRSGYKFKWWNKSSAGTGEDFYPGEKFNITANTDLYAVWEQVASGYAYWNGNDGGSGSPIDVTGNGVTMRLTKNSVDYNTGIKDYTVVSKYNGTTEKHADVLAMDAANEYLQIHFTDGSAINALELGTVHNGTSGTKKVTVIYSTTADFSSGEHEEIEVSIPNSYQSAKGTTDFSPSTNDKYFYARIYRSVSTAVYSYTGPSSGGADKMRIYSIKAQKGCSPHGLAYGTATVNKTYGDAAFTNALTNGHSLTVSYSSGDDDVATVNISNGQVTIKGAGSTTITATWAGSAAYCEGTASYTLNVAKKAISASLSYDETTLTVGDDSSNPSLTGNTDSGTVTWESSDEDVATVDEYGVVTAVGAGTATITATIAATDNYLGNTTTVDFTINPACSAPGVVSVVPNTGNNGAGSYQYGDELTLTASCADGTDASTTYAWYKGADWSTAKAAGAIQSAKTAAAGGTTYTKSAELSDAGTYWCEASNGSGCETHNLLGTDISVGKAAFTPDLNYESLPIPVGSTRDPVLTGVPDGAGAATYRSSDTDVAEVDSETGVVTAKAAGTATIRVDIAESSNYIDRYDTKTITVREAILYTVTFDPNGGEIDDSTDPVEMEQATEGAALTMPTPEHATYTFDGWYIADTEIGDEGAYTPTKDVTAYAKWIQECSGGGVSVEFTSSNKNDNGVYFADFSSTSQMVGTGSAKLIAIGDAKINADNKKDGYRSDSRMEMVFKFASSSTLDVYVTTGSTSRTYALYSFSSAKELSTIEATDYSSNTIVASNVTAAGATFANTTVKGTPSVSSGIITISGTAGGVKISYTNLSGYYVFKALGTSESYIYGFDINGGSSDCYRVNYHSNGADGGLTFDPQAYDAGDKPTVVANGFTFEHETEFLGWNTEEDGSGTMYQAGDKLSISDDDIDLYAQWMPINRFTAAVNWFWNNAGNWSHGVLPNEKHKVIIEKDCELRTAYGYDKIAKAKTIIIDKCGDNTGRLTIGGPAGLAVEEMIMTKNADGDLVATSTSDLNINSSDLHENGALAVKGYKEEGGVDMNATVYAKTKARVFGWIYEGEYNGFYVNQFIGTPMRNAKTMDYYGSWIYRWDATAPEEGDDAGKGDWVYASGAMSPFQGYALLMENHNESYLWLQGALAYSDDKTLDLPYDSRHENLAGSESMFANSWMAPIDVTQFETTDFAGGDASKMEATIYVFNSGTPNNWSDNEKEGKGNIGEYPGQFLCMSIKTAEYTGSIAEISSMQAFSVYAKTSGATLNLDYDRLVYQPLKSRETDIAPMRAPSNKAAANSNDPDVMKIMVECEHGADKLFMLSRADFNAGFDNGWDARKLFGESFAPQLYAFTQDGNMTINCVPDEEGTVLGFRKGSVDSVYSFSFTYNGEKMLYLNDLKEQTSTLISEENTYEFTAEAGDAEARFIISASPIAPVVTGIEQTNGKAQDAKVRKIMINDHVYIIRNGRMYSIDGAVVK